MVYIKGGVIMFGLIPRGSNHQVTDFFNDNFFDDNLMNFMNAFNHSMNGSFKVDVKENDKNYTIEADLPGINKEEIALDYNNGTLYIAVNHNEEVKKDNKEYIHRERRVESMQRGIYVGDIDIKGIDAKLEKGVLHITVPKVEVAEDKYRIEIH